MELTGEKRQKLGKATKSLKTEGLIPAVVFGKGLKSSSISIKNLDFVRVFDEAGETSLIDLKITGEQDEKVLVKDVQYNPVYGNIIHVGFYKPNLKEKTTAEIPVEIIGADKNPLVKSGQAMVLVLMQEIEVEALPTDLPHTFNIDITNLEKVGDGVTVAGLEYDKSKVTIKDLEDDDLVVKLESAQMAEEKEEEVKTEAEVIEGMEATAEKAEEAEGEEGAESGKEKETSKVDKSEK